jgi:hypothetical protein
MPSASTTTRMYGHRSAGDLTLDDRTGLIVVMDDELVGTKRDAEICLRRQEAKSGNPGAIRDTETAARRTAPREEQRRREVFRLKSIFLDQTPLNTCAAHFHVWLNAACATSDEGIIYAWRQSAAQGPIPAGHSLAAVASPSSHALKEADPSDRKEHHGILASPIRY